MVTAETSDRSQVYSNKGISMLWEVSSIRWHERLTYIPSHLGNVLRGIESMVDGMSYLVNRGSLEFWAAPAHFPTVVEVTQDSHQADLQS